MIRLPSRICVRPKPLGYVMPPWNIWLRSVYSRSNTNDRTLKVSCLFSAAFASALLRSKCCRQRPSSSDLQTAFQKGWNT